MHPLEIYTRDIHWIRAYGIRAYEIHAYAMDAHKMHAREMQPHKIYAYGMHAHGMHAREIYTCKYMPIACTPEITTLIFPQGILKSLSLSFTISNLAGGVLWWPRMVPFYFLLWGSKAKQEDDSVGRGRKLFNVV
jgi:hypothetical protein